MTPDLIWASFMRTFLAPARWLNYQRVFFYEKNLQAGAEKWIEILEFFSERLSVLSCSLCRRKSLPEI